jgi:hypothetical protein
MTQPTALKNTFMGQLGPRPEELGFLKQFLLEMTGTDLSDLRGEVNWYERLSQPVADGAMNDGSFGDFVEAVHNADPATLSLQQLAEGFKLLLADRQTPNDIKARLLPSLTAPLVAALRDPAKADFNFLLRLMDKSTETIHRSSLDEKSKGLIATVREAAATKLNTQISANWPKPAALAAA